MRQRTYTDVRPITYQQRRYAPRTTRGLVVVLCPVNLDCAPWHHEIRTTKERCGNEEFERVLMAEFYNIRNAETG